MKPASFTAGSLLLALALCTWGADTPREWKSGTLFEMEKEQVRTGTTKRTNEDATVDLVQTRAIRLDCHNGVE